MEAKLEEIIMFLTNFSSYMLNNKQIISNTAKNDGEIEWHTYV